MLHSLIYCKIIISIRLGLVYLISELLIFILFNFHEMFFFSYCWAKLLRSPVNFLRRFLISECPGKFHHMSNLWKSQRFILFSRFTDWRDGTCVQDERLYEFVSHSFCIRPLKPEWLACFYFLGTSKFAFFIFRIRNGATACFLSVFFQDHWFH